MRVVNPKRTPHATSPNGFRTLARFQLEPVEGVIIYDCTIVRAPDGRLLVYGPVSRGGSQVLSLAPETRRSIIEMMALEVEFDHDQRTAA